jgi:hypothetical protein
MKSILLPHLKIRSSAWANKHCHVPDFGNDCAACRIVESQGFSRIFANFSR